MPDPRKPPAAEALDDPALADVTGGSNAPMPNIVSGTAGHDWIVGSASSDLIEGRGGRDEIHGLGGTDVVDGGEGNDTLLGGQGNDALFGGAGDDAFVWLPGDGDDVVRGGAGHDILLLAGVGMSREDLIAAIVVEEGSPLPSIGPDHVDLTGVRGTLVIGTERITFEGLEQLRLMHW